MKKIKLHASTIVTDLRAIGINYYYYMCLRVFNTCTRKRIRHK